MFLSVAFTVATAITTTDATTSTKAATASVVGKPSQGMSTKPAASVPATEPMVFTAYTTPKRRAGEWLGSPTMASASGNAAPRQTAVGTTSSAVSSMPRLMSALNESGEAAISRATARGT